MSSGESENFYTDVDILIFIETFFLEGIQNPLEMFFDDDANGRGLPRARNQGSSPLSLSPVPFARCSYPGKCPGDCPRLPRGNLRWSQKQNKAMTYTQTKRGFVKSAGKIGKSGRAPASRLLFLGRGKCDTWPGP